MHERCLRDVGTHPRGKVLVTGTRFIPDLSKFESGFKRACQSAPKSGIRRVVLSHISLDLYQTLTQLFITLNSLEYNPTFPQLILNLLAVRIPGIDFKLKLTSAYTFGWINTFSNPVC